MNLYLRLFWIIFWALRYRGPKLDPTKDVGRIYFRILPTDCDINIHLTQSRYPAFGDLGRVDFGARMGLGPVLREKGWALIAGSIHTDFKKEIKPFEKACVETRFLGWIGSKFLAEHRYSVQRKGETVLNAISYVKFGFYDRRNKRFIQGEEIARIMDFPQKSPELTADMVDFLTKKLQA